MTKLFHIVVAFLISLNAIAQFSPPAGQEGTTAIHKDSSVFIDWATTCIVERGYLNNSLPDSGLVSAGEDVFATGVADNLIVSLGDGGKALMTFNKPIQNGPGPDFAVFENSFTDDFLELAFVEVSSNGIDFVRFPSVSLTQTMQQIGAFGLLDATKIHNLAGKYRGMYGVPFDLEDIESSENFDEYNITQVRIISVSGSIDSTYASFDSQGNIINDPWPTLFASGGFDLDAVGVINNSSNDTRIIRENHGIIIFPNPVEKYLNIQLPSEILPVNYTISDIYGKQFMIGNLSELPKQKVDIQPLPSGFYTIRLCYDNCAIIHKFIKK